jgi:ABC-2 type transport system ATP-binding protein
MIFPMEGNMTQTTLASLKGVRKRFGAIQALDGLDLSVNRGELLAVLGPNGAGKTTAIGMLLGLQSPDEGSAELFGVAPQEIDARRRIGVMMQEVQLAGVMRPRELLEQVASYYPVPYDLDSVVERLSLHKLMQRPYGKLSGGQKRQVQFALALCGRPELLFLDEPTAGLDIHARESLWKVIRELVHEGCSIVLTTHYLEEAEALADRVAVVMRGKLVTSGTVNEIRANESRKRVSCVTRLTEDAVQTWPEVTQAVLIRDRLQISTRNAEALLGRLLREDPALSDIEVKRAGLAEAFTELTNENDPGALS